MIVTQATAHKSKLRSEAKVLRVPHRAVRVAILGINYAPEPTGIAPYTTGLAMGLAKRGHEVLVLTGQPHYPYWKRDEASSRFRSEEQIDGVRVRRLSHPVPRRLSWIGRAAMELTFGLQLLTTRWGRPEVVICVTPPLLASRDVGGPGPVDLAETGNGNAGAGFVQSRGRGDGSRFRGRLPVRCVWWNRWPCGCVTVFR